MPSGGRVAALELAGAKCPPLPRSNALAVTNQPLAPKPPAASQRWPGLPRSPALTCEARPAAWLSSPFSQHWPPACCREGRREIRKGKAGGKGLETVLSNPQVPSPLMLPHHPRSGLSSSLSRGKTEVPKVTGGSPDHRAFPSVTRVISPASLRKQPASQPVLSTLMRRNYLKGPKATPRWKGQVGCPMSQCYPPRFKTKHSFCSCFPVHTCLTHPIPNQM